MIEIKEVKIDNKIRIEVGDRVYSRKENPIGVRSKFWAVRRGGKYIHEPPIITDLLFKYNRNDLSSENYGEIISSKFYKLCGLGCVDYYSAEFTDIDGNKFQGVMCGSYKKSNTELETSGYALQCVLTDFYFDRKTGKANKEINTVYGFISDLDSLYGDFQHKDYFLTNIKDELIKQSLLDFLIAQSDRHWTNTTFLEYFNKDNEYRIRKANCYDNGCIAFLKRKRQAIDTFSSMIGGDYLNSPHMKTLMDKYCPMFGIKTSTCLIDTRVADKYERYDKIRVNPDKDTKQTYLKELAQEILHNPEIAFFYIKLKEHIGYNRKNKSINLKPMFKSLENADEEIPDSIADVVTGIITYQVNEIEQELKKQVKLIDAIEAEKEQ